MEAQWFMPCIPEDKRLRLEDRQEVDASSRTPASQLYLVQGCRFRYRGWGDNGSPLLSKPSDQILGPPPVF